MIIKRYLTKEVMQSFLAVTVVLLFAFLSQQTVRFLSYIAVGKIPRDVFLLLIGFEIPYLLALLLPLGLFLGILLTYSRLYTDNELPVLQIYGFGNRQLLRLTAVFSAVVAFLVLCFMLWINPWIATKREQMTLSNQAAESLIQTLIPGRFKAVLDGRYVFYVERISRDHKRAENVFIAEERKSVNEGEQSKWTLILANQGYQRKDKASADQYLVTTDGYRYEGTPGQNDYKIIQFKKYEVRIPDFDVRASHIEDETLSTPTLMADYDIPERAAELQWRLSVGISAFLLALLAVPLSYGKPRYGRYLSLLPAILIYIIYVNLLFISRRWVEQGILPISLGMWWVHGLLLLLVILLITQPFRRLARRIAS